MQPNPELDKQGLDGVLEMPSRNKLPGNDTSPPGHLTLQKMPNFVLKLFIYLLQ